MAPGVAILAANIQESEPGQDLVGKRPSKYAIKSGTSMACPHVTGAAAFIKSIHPQWTPSMIKSALMTTGKLQVHIGRMVSTIIIDHEIQLTLLANQ